VSRHFCDTDSSLLAEIQSLHLAWPRSCPATGALAGDNFGAVIPKTGSGERVQDWWAVRALQAPLAIAGRAAARAPAWKIIIVQLGK